MSTTVVHCKRDSYDVYIGRGSKWGNPYTHLPVEETKALFQVASRQEALKAYEDYIKNNPELFEALSELKDRRLGCFCKPTNGFRGNVLCHGQILAGLCDGIPYNEVK